MAAVVSNLNDSGTGSLRDAIINGSGDVTFSVSGTIILKKPIVIARSSFSIDATGSGGITIMGHVFRCGYGGDSVTIRQLRLLPGDFNAAPGNGKLGRGLLNLAGDDGDGFSSSGVTGLVLENCSIYWSMDELLDLFDSDVTVRKCLFAEALNNSFYPSGNHGYGCLISMSTSNRTVRLYNNVFAHTTARNPAMTLDATGKLTLDLRGNLFYNSTTHAFHCTVAATNADINVVGNCWRDGPDTDWGVNRWLGIAAIDLYQTGNTRELADGTIVDPWATDAALSGQLTASEIDLSGDAVLSRDELLETVGASDTRWDYDQQIIDQVVNRTGATKDSISNSVVPESLRSTPDLRTGLLSYWPFNGNTNDAFGSVNLTGSGTYNDTKVNAAILIASGQTLSATDPDTLDFGTDDAIGIAFWLKYATNPGASNYVIYKQASLAAASAGYTVYTSPSGANATLGFYLADGTNAAFYLGGTITPNTWHHCAATFDPAASVGGIFIDGVRVDGTPSASVDNLGSLSNSTNLVFNRPSASTSMGLDEVRIYRRALRIEDVNALMRLTAPQTATRIVKSDPSSRLLRRDPARLV